MSLLLCDVDVGKHCKEARSNRQKENKGELHYLVQITRARQLDEVEPLRTECEQTMAFHVSCFALLIPYPLASYFDNKSSSKR